MLCPKCKVEMLAKNQRLTFEGDESPDTETKAFLTSDFVCRNPQCENYGRVVDTVDKPWKLA